MSYTQWNGIIVLIIQLLKKIYACFCCWDSDSDLAFIETDGKTPSGSEMEGEALSGVV